VLSRDSLASAECAESIAAWGAIAMPSNQRLQPTPPLRRTTSVTGRRTACGVAAGSVTADTRVVGQPPSRAHGRLDSDMVIRNSYDDNPSTAEFYDHVVPYCDRPDVAFYVEEASRSGGPVLELGCGTGRILIPTARAGIEIVGVDASESMLSVCRRNLDGEPDTVRALVKLRQGDMRDFELGQSFGLITMPFRSFQHVLTVDEQLCCLACIRQHLTNGGRLVFDVFNPSLAMLTSPDVGTEIGEEPEFTLPSGSRVTRRYRVTSRDHPHQQNAVELIYYVSHPDGSEERIVHGFSMRYLFRYELEHLLARSGFELRELYADFDRQPYGSKYPGDLIAIAEAARTGAG